MSSLFLSLFLLSLLLLIIGLVKPNVFSRLYKCTPPRKTVWKHYGLAALVFFVLAAATNEALPQSDPEHVVLESTSVTSPAPSEEPSSSPSSEIKKLYPVAEIVDGDTLKVTINNKLETVRLIGIDTPETVDPRKPVQCFGREASDKTAAILAEKRIELESDATQGDRDKYGRLLRYVRLEDGTNVNKLLIAEGYAHEYTYDSHPYKYQSEFKEAEKQARESNKGLWADSTCSGTTSSPAITPTPVPPSQPTAQPKASASVVDGIDYDCGDFSTHAAAQAYFESQGGSPTNNVDRLDGDHDGLACENNP